MVEGSAVTKYDAARDIQMEQEQTGANLEELFNDYLATEPEQRFPQEVALLKCLSKAGLDEIVGFLVARDESGGTELNQLSQQVVDSLLERTFSQLEDKDGGERTAFLLSRAFLLSHAGGKISQGSISDKTMKALPDLYDKYPAAVESFFSGFGQDAQVVQPEILFTEGARFFAKKDLSPGMRRNLASSLNYVAHFNLSEFLAERLQPERLANVGQSGQLLDLMYGIKQWGENWNNSKKLTDQLTQALQRVEKESRSYFIKKKAGHIQKGVENRSSREAKEADTSKKSEYGIEGLDMNKINILPIAPGKAGVFMLDGRLYGYLEPAEKPEKKWKLAEVRKIEDESMFTQRAGLSSSDKTKQAEILRDFDYLQSMVMRQEIEEDFGVKLADFSLREQMWFLAFLRDKDIDNVKEAQKFVSEYGRDGLRTFLSLEYSQDMGEKILALGESAPKEAAEAIFAKYNQIVDAANRVREYLQSNFRSERDYSEETSNQITDNLLRRGQQLLVHYADRMGSTKAQREISAEQILKQLEDVKAGALLFASTFKAMTDEGSVDFSEFRDVSLEVTEAGELDDEDKRRMSEIHVNNRPGYSPELLKATLNTFDEGLEDPSSRFYILRHQEDGLVGFVRFNKGHIGGFNIVAGARGSKIGGEFFRQVVDEESKHNIIIGEANPASSITASYVERYGFVIDSMVDYEDSGQQFMEIVRDNQLNSKLISRQRSVTELMSERQQNVDNLGYEIFSFDQDTQQEELSQLLEARLGDGGYLLTRYFKPDKKSGEIYIVLEKNPQTENEG
ncbi:MAG: hypothetical protein ABII72_00625 [Parcubacteria group bacterium]